MSFSELKKQVGIESSGHLNFHLEKLSRLTEVGPDGNYRLNDEGREAVLLAKSLGQAGPAQTRRRLELLRASPKLVMALGLVVIVLLASLILAVHYPGLLSPTPTLPGTVESFSQIFGSNYQSENVTFVQLPVGANVTFAGVVFTRLPFTGLPGFAAGYNMSWTLPDGNGGVGAVTSQDGNFAYSNNPSSGQAEGYFVYPSQGIFRLVVKT